MASPSRNRIGDILVKARVIDDLQLRSAMATLDQWGGRLSRVVADLGLASEDIVTEAICQGLGMQRVQLGNISRDASALARVEVGLAEQKAVFPVSLKDNGKTLVLAMADPTDLATLDQVAARSRARVVPMVAGEREIEHAILRHYRNQEPVASSRFAPSRSQSANTPSTVDEEQQEEDEFKVVDMSGNTVVKRIADIVPPGSPATAPAPRAADKPAPPVANGSSSAADILDEILAGGVPASEWTDEDLQRLQTLQQNQEKSSKILRALLELLLEKGKLQQRELAAKMRL
ncbi:general secretion pathway protein GspE [Myxococcus sp. CA051A]|uniref:General secretion pathway protein GspE n=1 Tax=Myxococcus llanfairpwllgwyngyllgogerychwyrndrobwllllantysiliogogogochensis TaxID=2590453 RepID=A0A540X1S1_9BACT|nr:MULTISPECIES: general secretion pathway protein GspE [Myxococcus]NTX09310.1 general secretion pathway protein GspE [Myxococcus sp. CA056]NTX61272.1 general secretion pathway protein GspE [Myxococcus sp. CA051A]TQF15198.1 general secretion pathway protein GspE [Myxococcus llanfairpwllgwyngyllgogerychwyrndrobwllllantysiliogogogochensis]